MTHPLAHHRARLADAANRLAVITAALPTAWRNLADAQPGYPTGSDGPGAGGVTDRTGNLAAANLDDGYDFARSDLDTLDTLLAQLWTAADDADRIVRRWLPPTDQWRKALATEAAARLTSEWNHCTAHTQVGSIEPARRADGRLCRWCEDLARELGVTDPPLHLVERRARGMKITTADLDAIKRERKRRRKTKR